MPTALDLALHLTYYINCITCNILAIIRSASYSNSHTLIFSWPGPGSKIIGKAYRGKLCAKDRGAEREKDTCKCSL